MKNKNLFEINKYMKNLLKNVRKRYEEKEAAHSFREGDDYWTIEEGWANRTIHEDGFDELDSPDGYGIIVRSCWDDVSEEMFKEDPNKLLFGSRATAYRYLVAWNRAEG